MSRFEQVVNRRGTCCAKWDGHRVKGVPEQALPLWVADMDFETVPAVTAAIEERCKHEVYGYSLPSDSYYISIVEWMQRRHNWEIMPEWIVSTPGVVPALNLAIQTFTAPGEGVLLQNPVYPPFTNSVLSSGRSLVNSPLRLQDGKYKIDFADFEQKIISNRVKLFILCSPHNPVGRVWSHEELKQLGEICLKHQVLIVSDEIHQDFIFPEYRHYPLPTVDPAFIEITLVCTAPSKTFNLAGLQASNIIIANQGLRDRFAQAAAAWGLGKLNTYGLVACEAAYNHGDEWLDTAIDYVAGNLRWAREFIQAKLPLLRLVEPEGMYLLWLDFSRLGLDHLKLEQFLLHEAGLWLNQGYAFGAEGNCFARLNIACHRSTLAAALTQLEQAVNRS